MSVYLKVTLAWIRTARPFLYWGLSGVFFVWMWFLPVFWNLTETRDGAWIALWDIFLWPSTPEYMLGAGIDQLGTFWIFGSLPEILTNNGRLPNLFYPIGWDIGFHTGYAWLDGILSLPLQWLGVPVFYNLHVAVTLWLSFVGLCWLIDTVGREIKYCWLLAPILSALTLWTPFCIEEISMGRPTQVYWIFSSLFLGLLLKQPNTTIPNYRFGVGIGLTLVAACFVYWFGGVSVGFIAGVVMLCTLWQQPHKRSFVIQNITGGVFAVGLSGLLVSQMLLQLWSGENSFEQLTRQPIRTWGWFDLPIYSIEHLSTTEAWLNMAKTHPSTLPILLFGCVGMLIPIGWRRRWPWMVGWLLALGIPLSGAIQVGDWLVPTGQGLLQWIFPLLLRCEYPERMVVAPTLLSLIVGMQGLTALYQSLSTTKWKLGLLTLVGILACWQLTPPTAKNLRVSSFVKDEIRFEIAQRFPGAMIDAPFSRSENTYIQQLFHQQPLLGGPGLNRVQPPAHKAYCQANGLLKGLEELDQSGETQTIFSQSDITQLIQDGFTVIVYDPQAKRFSADTLEKYIGIEPQFQDGRTGIRAYLLEDIRTQ